MKLGQLYPMRGGKSKGGGKIYGCSVLQRAEREVVLRKINGVSGYSGRREWI